MMGGQAGKGKELLRSLLLQTISLPPSLPAYLAHQAVQGRMGGGARRTQIHGFLFREGGREGGEGGREKG